MFVLNAVAVKWCIDVWYTWHAVTIATGLPLEQKDRSLQHGHCLRATQDDAAAQTARARRALSVTTARTFISGTVLDVDWLGDGEGNLCRHVVLATWRSAEYFPSDETQFRSQSRSILTSPRGIQSWWSALHLNNARRHCQSYGYR